MAYVPLHLHLNYRHLHPNPPSDSCFKNMLTPPNRGEDYTIPQAIFSIDMIIIFLATISGVGGTLTAIDNLGQIGESLRYPSHSITTFISLVSIWNYLGRVVSGFVSEYFWKKYRVPRPLFLFARLVLSCVRSSEFIVFLFNRNRVLLRRTIAIDLCNHIGDFRVDLCTV